MVGDGSRHPVIVDTDAMIAVANTSLWSRITQNLRLTTTNVCHQELKRHTEEMSPQAPEGTREKWVHTGSKRALEPFEDEENESFTVVTSVPRPHGKDAGEESVKREVTQNTEVYRFVILMDKHGRQSINRVFSDTEETAGRAIAPPFLLYLLLDKGDCTVKEFCHACGEILEGEGWTGYQAVQAAWEAIPVDCSQHLSDDLLPE